MDESVRDRLKEFLAKALDEERAGLGVGKASGAKIEESFGARLRDGGAVRGFDVVGKDF